MRAGAATGHPGADAIRPLGGRPWIRAGGNCVRRYAFAAWESRLARSVIADCHFRAGATRADHRGLSARKSPSAVQRAGPRGIPPTPPARVFSEKVADRAQRTIDSVLRALDSPQGSRPPPGGIRDRLFAHRQAGHRRPGGGTRLPANAGEEGSSAGYRPPSGIYRSFVWRR